MIKKSKIYSGFDWEKQWVEVFINPTSEEIEITKNNDPNHGVRGNINRDGNKYIWIAEIGHFSINRRYLPLNKRIPMDYFRFGWDGFWSLHEGEHGNKMSFKELKEIIQNNYDFLSQIGDFNVRVEVIEVYDQDDKMISPKFDSLNELLKTKL